MTVDEIADALRVKKSWVYRQMRMEGEDQIPHVRAGKYLRFRLNEVLKWLEDRQ